MIGVTSDLRAVTVPKSPEACAYSAVGKFCACRVMADGALAGADPIPVDDRARSNHSARQHVTVTRPACIKSDIIAG